MKDARIVSRKGRKGITTKLGTTGESLAQVETRSAKELLQERLASLKAEIAQVEELERRATIPTLDEVMATKLKMTLGGVEHLIEAHQYNAGSYGFWMSNKKQDINVAGKKARMTVQVCCVIEGSKPKVK